MFLIKIIILSKPEEICYPYSCSDFDEMCEF